MGKYIVEVKDGETLYKAVIAPDGEPYITPAMGNVYTEPDLEQVRKEAYEKGWKEAEDHYEKGYNDGYDTGLSHAWEAARNVVALSTVDRREVFGSEYMYSILEKHTAVEAIEKIRQYEQKKEEIKVGDEVITASGKAVVTSVGPVYFEYVYANGSIGSDKVKNAKKTGRHFPEIAAVFEKMRGEQDD